MIMTSSTDLSEDQLNEAVRELVIKYPRLEKLPVDPPIAGQKFGLFSFKLLPSPVNGVYGFLKFRGAFNTEQEWISHSKNIIRTVDSKHKIWPFEQGRWMPITNNSSFASDVVDVQQQDEMKQIFNKNETEEQKNEIRKTKEVKDRVSKLLEESKLPEADTDSLEYYAQQYMKLQQTETWLEIVRKRKREFVASLTSTSNELKRLDQLHPNYINEVDEKIKAIKAEVGLDTS